MIIFHQNIRIGKRLRVLTSRNPRSFFLLNGLSLYVTETQDMWEEGTDQTYKDNQIISVPILIKYF